MYFIGSTVTRPPRRLSDNPHGDNLHDDTLHVSRSNAVSCKMAFISAAAGEIISFMSLAKRKCCCYHMLRVGANEVLLAEDAAKILGHPQNRGHPQKAAQADAITESHFKSGWRWENSSAFNDGDLNGVRQTFEALHPWV